MSHATALPDFATIRRIRDRQVLITRSCETDEHGDDIECINITFDIQVGIRVNNRLEFDSEEDRDVVWNSVISGEYDEGLAEYIDAQEKQWAGLGVSEG